MKEMTLDFELDSEYEIIQESVELIMLSFQGQVSTLIPGVCFD